MSRQLDLPGLPSARQPQSRAPRLFAEIRLAVAYALASLALKLAPRGHRETAIMARHWSAWIAETLHNRTP